ncbi:DsbA family protein [Jiella sp. M17.18]|uniref:DsbA family protein n=1 Tax=Jiella sp. M17.18 TaxID=3234247 RepID=UPI0034DE686B
MPSAFDRRRFLTATLAGGLALAAGPALAAPDPLSKRAVLYDPAAPVLGNPRGDVTVVEWFDYQCPYCKKAYPEVMKTVAEDGHIRLVMKDWPIFGLPSEYAAHLTLAAGKYRPRALDALMKTPGQLTDATIDARLTAAGFDVAALKAAYARNRTRIDALLKRNKAQAEGFGFFGTPAYMVGTTLFPGVPAMADFRQAIRDARAAGR